MVKPRRAASATARSMRTGSSRKRTDGSPMVRISLFVEVLQPADVVDHREVRDVVEKRVDREVAAERVLRRRAEGVVAADQRLGAFLRLGLPAEGRRPRPPSCRTARGTAGSGGRPMKQFRNSSAPAGSARSSRCRSPWGGARAAGRARRRPPGSRRTRGSSGGTGPSGPRRRCPSATPDAPRAGRSSARGFRLAPGWNLGFRRGAARPSIQR